jgi:predicted transcriptional regulator
MTSIFNRKYRDRLDIYSEILELGNGNEVRVGNISNKSGLPHNLLKKYLKILLQNNLLKYRKEDKTFKTTSKGIYFIGLYHNLLNAVLPDTILHDPSES